MEKSYCSVCNKDTEKKQLKDKTPQGWPMEIEECQGCKLRTLTNDPEADAKKEA